MANLLGKRLKDKVTGLEGIAVTKCIYLNGCIQYAIQAEIKQDGTLPKQEWVDIQTLEVISDGVINDIPDSTIIPSSPTPGGGFRNHPKL